MPGLAALRAHGPDAHRFLQSQLTQDLALARSDQTCFAGWADAKGRLHWVGHLWEQAPGTWVMLVPDTMADPLAHDLRRFVLRARVAIERAALRLAAARSAVEPPADWRAVTLAGDTARALWVGPPGAGLHAAETLTADAWEWADIVAGLPGLEPATRGEFVPQMVNLDLLGGVSFTKGCYPGQEIVARTRYLGRVKRRMLRYDVAGPRPAAGTEVLGPRGAAGQVVRSAARGSDATLLAVMQLDGLPVAPVLADGRPLRPMLLPYPIPELEPAAGG